jgi:transcriptional regulator with XRE-family HTH domain
MSESSAGIPDLAAKLQHLFRTIPRPDGQGWYTNEVMVQAVADQGVQLTVQHLSSLRNGRRNNPSARLLAAIAAVFGVPVDYFFDADEERRVNEDLQTLTQLRRVGGLRLRGEIDPKGLLELLDALQQIRQMEGERRDDEK